MEGGVNKSVKSWCHRRTKSEKKALSEEWWSPPKTEKIDSLIFLDLSRCCHHSWLNIAVIIAWCCSAVARRWVVLIWRQRSRPIAQVDDIKLKDCDACDLVSYCSDKCQRDHRTQHEAICKKRAAKLRDEILFEQPESTHLGDCPICCLPLSIDEKKSIMMSCCCKMICDGCAYAYQRTGCCVWCPFSRHPVPKTEEESDRIAMKWVAANDPVAIRRMGAIRFHGGDSESAFKYWTKAAELGNVEAHYSLSILWRRTSKRRNITWKSLQLATIRLLDIILQ